LDEQFLFWSRVALAPALAKRALSPRSKNISGYAVP
jgi:hypothetical protein